MKIEWQYAKNGGQLVAFRVVNGARIYDKLPEFKPAPQPVRFGAAGYEGKK
jgi:hypothetical protein